MDLGLSIIHYGSGPLPLHTDLYQCLRSFHKYACRSMYRITITYTI
jgi:hypothetical protein